MAATQGSATPKADEYLAQKGIHGLEGSYRGMMERFLVDFDNADTSEPGVLTRDEVQTLCQNNQILGQRGVEGLFETFDVDKSNKITRDEFVHLFLRTWATRVYIQNFANPDDVTVDGVCDVMGRDGYDVNRIRSYIKKQGYETDGKVDLAKFLENYFNPLLAKE